MKKSLPECCVPQKMNWERFLWVTFGLLMLYWVLSIFGVFHFNFDTGRGAVGLLAVFGIGVVASVSSCGAVVGGLLAAISATFAEHMTERSKFARFRPHLFFNAGRLIGFAGFGALIGLIGSSVQLSPGVNGVMVLAIALFMLALGWHLLGLIPRNVFPMPKWLARRVHALSESKHPFAPALLGAGTFFLPCGFTQSIQLFALSLQDPAQASLILFVFALGTMPALLGIGAVTSLSSQQTLKTVAKIAGVLVFLVGMSNLFNGLTLLNLHPASVFAGTPTSSTSAVVAEGKQVIETTITKSFTYSPSVVTVKKDVPVEWHVYGHETMGCARSLVLPAFGVNTILDVGENVVEFVPAKAGRFTFSCSMGMVRGTMIVEE